MTLSPRDHFHVVLVEPGESLNVGAVARAMGNLGFRHLHLVAPRGYDRDRAAVTACWAEPLLDTLILHPTLDDALAVMQLAVGFSMGLDGKDIPLNQIDLPRWLDTLPDAANAPALPQTALVFGPEENGLRLEHLQRCRWIVRIPSDAACPSFNLAQSILIALYELTKRFAGAPDNPGDITALAEADLPTGNERRQLERLLDAVMQESGFVRPGSPAPVPGIVHSLFRRLDLSRREMGVLLGLLGRVNTTLARMPSVAMRLDSKAVEDTRHSQCDAE